MSSSPVGSAAPITAERVAAQPRSLSQRDATGPTRVAFVGTHAALAAYAPRAQARGLVYEQVLLAGAGIAPAIPPIAEGAAHVSVVFDPQRLGAEQLSQLPGVTLGVLTEAGAEVSRELTSAPIVDRLVSFDPVLTGERVAGTEVWRAIAPPVSDGLFGEVRALHTRPRVMTIGRSSAHREAMLMPAKHQHDLLQLVYGVCGEELAELLREYDVGVYVPREEGGAFGQQAAAHLAAGQLLLAAPLAPTHGLERDIDYLQIDSPEGLVWMLDRLDRFPEMYQRVRVRGRLKAEHFRASRVFAQVIHDLLADVTAFGSERGGSGVQAPAVLHAEERDLGADDAGDGGHGALDFNGDGRG